MRAKYSSIGFFIFTFFFVACAAITQQNKKECDNDTVSTVIENKELNKEFIISLIKKDEERRNIWSFDFKQSASSPLLYEAICDDGLYLYRVASNEEQVSVFMLEDANIGYLTDPITDYTQYEHNGHYEVIDDSTVDVIFDKWYRNYCQLDDSNRVEYLYHIRCTHSYTFANMKWELLKTDTIVLTDERNQFCDVDIRKYIY